MATQLKGGIADKLTFQKNILWLPSFMVDHLIKDLVATSADLFSLVNNCVKILWVYESSHDRYELHAK